MRAPKYDIVVRAPGGSYERLGSGQMSTAQPENIRHVHQLPWGPTQLSWTMHRDNDVSMPDEQPYTEVIGLLDGVNAFSGRQMRAPRSKGQESILSPAAEGWGVSHLNDYPIDREWAISDMTRFVDARSSPVANLALNRTMASAQVNVGDGAITLMNPSGTALATDSLSGVYIDLGPNNIAKRAIVVFESSNNTASHKLQVQDGPTSDPWAGGATGNISVLNNAGPTGTLRLTFAGPTGRYVHIFNQLIAAYTPGADVWFKIKSVQIFTSTAYESGDASALKASTVIGEALTSGAAPRISSDQSGIQATSFNIPAYGTSGRRSIADICNDVNAYHQWQLLLTPELVPRPIFRPVPTTPTWVINEVDAYEYDDAGANEGAEVIDTCIVQYQDAAGSPLEAIATASGTILSKAGYSRARVLQARSKMTPASALQLAQAYVAAYQTSPFKGKVKVKGTITRWADSAPIWVGLITAGDAVLVAPEVNTNTGFQGRVGIIQKVEYVHNDLTADIELDSTRNYMDVIMARLAIVVR